MQNIKFYSLIILTICSFSHLNAQIVEDATKESIINLQTDGYEIVLSKYGDGKQNLGWEEGEKLFGMGGNLQEILQKLLPEFEWKVDKKWLRDTYHLRINYNSDTQSKQEVNQIFLTQLANALGANIEKSKIKKEAICVDWAASKGEDNLQKAQDRNVMNQIMKRGNVLNINSVKLHDLDRLVNINSDYNLKMENAGHSSIRFDFSFDINNRSSFIESLKQYGFEVDECEEDKILVSLF